jgi:hypothetical protein
MARNHVLMLLAKSIDDLRLKACIDHHDLGPELRPVVSSVRDSESLVSELAQRD